MTEKATDFDDLSTAAFAEAGGRGEIFLLLYSPAGLDVRAIKDGDTFSIGRGKDATITIDDSRVSRLHTRIKRIKGTLLVTDLASRNGTRINGHRVYDAERAVAGGDTISIGPLEIHVAFSSRMRARALDVVEEAAASPGGLVVADPVMQKVFQVAHRLAQTQTNVLILGETGVGKEILAEHIHKMSARCEATFLRLSCASLVETLLESELFGHEKGAFTGATKQKIGLFEAANLGTLFLDEIGEISAATQVKLLRVLETRRMMRLGGTKELEIDVRLVCATHRDLERDVASGKFREDLFYRINTFTLRVPPLRERKMEIVLLAELFAQRLAAAAGKGPLIIDRHAHEALARHGWPGNVRELKNAIEHAAVLAENQRILEEHLPDSVRHSQGKQPRDAGELKDRVSSVERKAIEDALHLEDGNQTRAAKRLGLSRRALIYKLEKYGLRRDR